MEETTDRYARHHLIDWWDQKRLASARVMVVGAGAIGNEVIKNLALLGVGNLWVVDFDTVEVTNLTRSVLFRETDIGRSKAEVASERAKEINPAIQVKSLSCDLEYEIGLGVYRSMDVVIGCLDSIQARLALNRACLRAGVAWLNGGIEVTVGEVSYFASEEGACFECTMSPSMWEQHHKRFSCGGLRSDTEEAKMPTTAVVASVVAGYLVNEALFLLHRATEEPKEGLEPSQKLVFLLKPYRLDVYRLPRDPNCLAHERWEPLTIMPFSPQQITAKAVFEYLGMPEGILELDFDLLTHLTCLECGAVEEVLRPLEKSSSRLSLCPQCGTKARQPETICWIDKDSEIAMRPLSDLGIPEYAVLRVKQGGEETFAQLSGEYA